MGTRITREGSENIYAAAQAWVNAALRSDASLFTPGKDIWSGRWLRELRERFLETPDLSKRKFLEKLRDQLHGSPGEVYQLMAEALYFHHLIVSTRDGSNKRRDIETVLGWSSSPAVIPEDLVQSLTPGIANTGQYFHVKRPHQVGFLLEFAEQWKEMEAGDQFRLLEDPWAFKSFVMGLEVRSRTLKDEPNSYRTQREALLHLAFPDVFEGIVSTNHKHWIGGTFAKFIEDPAEDVDRLLAQIRPEIEARYGYGDYVHYRPEVRTLWDSNYSPDLWNDFVRHAQEYCATGQLEVEEIKYKIDTGGKLAEARRAVIEEADDWAVLVKSGIGGNLVHPIQQAKFRGWVDESPTEALFALQMLWEGDEDNPVERIDSFCELLPARASSGPGTRTTIASVLLMGLDVEQYPPFRMNAFNAGYRQTGYGEPERDATEAGLYEYALEFLDRFIEEASSRGLPMRHRLDAQSLLWAIQSEPPPDVKGTTPGKLLDEEKPPQAASLNGWESIPLSYSVSDIMADGCFLESARLEEILEHLSLKKNLILQGPPGTGKTWLARKLAFALIGYRDEGKVQAVQFHPNLSYEDFVRGWRPSGDGRLDLVDGPFLEMIEAARSDLDSDYVMVIEKINRGNPAQVFGEMLTLLESDKRRESEALGLSYRKSEGERVHIPDNVYVIGTMNLADRSLALVDLAFRRRFAFEELEPTFGQPWRDWVSQHCGIDARFLADIEERLSNLNRQIAGDRNLGRQFRVGHSYVTPSAVIPDPSAWFTRVVEKEIGPLLDEYWFDSPETAQQAKSALLEGL